MLEELRKISTSAVETLLEIKQEQERLQGYLDRAEELGKDVDPVVYKRVRDDYQRRIETLEKKSLPAKDEARKHYQECMALHRRLKLALDEARLEKDELEFRHSVGELSDDESSKKREEADDTLKQRNAEVEEADALRHQFIEAFPSEEDLEKEPPPQPPASSRKTAKPVAPKPEVVIDEDATRVLPSDVILEAVSSPPAGDAGEDDKTLAVPTAVLIVEESGREFPLGVLMFIGRDPENQIQMNEPGVSRRHASLTYGKAGFALKDEQSHYGTFVNEQKISEHILTDGDKVRIGGVEMVFKMD